MDNSNLDPTIQPNSLKPFGKFCVTIGMLPSSYKQSMTYEEQLLWFCNYLENTVIPAVNNNAEALTELQNLYVELKNYVDNYFSNLDVQEEINNKLDEMAQDGTLTKALEPFMKDYSQQISSLEEQINLANSRINEFTTLPEGSTSADAEIADARVGYNGTTYENLGTAIRTQISNIINSTLNASGLNILENNKADICSGDLNQLPNNTTYAIATNVQLLNIPNLLGGFIISFGKQKTRSTGDMQIFVDANNNFFYRIFWANNWANWTNVLNFSGLNITETNKADICSGDLNQLPNNTTYAIATNVQLLNIPNLLGGFIISFGKQKTRSTGDMQIFVDANNNFFYRIFWAKNWADWTLLKKGFNNKSIKYSVLGDSRSTFRGISSYPEHCHYPDNYLKNSNQMWWYIVEQFFNLQRVEIDAFSGSTVSTGRPLEGYNGYEFVSDTRINALENTDNQPDLIFVYGGINDFYGSVDIGNISPNSNNTNTLKQAMIITISKIQNKFPNAKIYWILENFSNYRVSEDNLYVINLQNVSLGDYIEAQKQACTIMQIPYIDTSSLNISKDNVTNYLPDNLHGNPTFHKKFAEIIINKLQQDYNQL